MPNLIQKLQAHKETVGLSDEEMGQLLGMRARMWIYVSTGRYALSNKALGHVVRNFKGLHQDVLDYLASEIDRAQLRDVKAS